MPIESYPNELELLSFFECEPEIGDEPWHYTYIFTDQNNLSLLFTFNVIEGWFQVILKVNENIISHYLSEGVKSFQIKDNAFLLSKTKFSNNTGTIVEIRLKPYILVRCMALVDFDV